MLPLHVKDVVVSLQVKWASRSNLTYSRLALAPCYARELGEVLGKFGLGSGEEGEYIGLDCGHSNLL